MKKRLNRREFVRTAAGAAAVAAPRAAFGQSAAVITRGVRPVVIASENGHEFKNGGTQTCVERAFSLITKGADVLEALVEGVTIVELDPNETGVGWSGLPNADGVVQLDACCMHGPKRRAGGVAAIEGVRTPAKVAHLVAEQTDHHLLVGKGAQEFARAMGIPIEDGLIGDKAREQWLEWKRRTDPLHYLDPKTRAQVWYDTGLQMVREGRISPHHFWGTINCSAVNAKGETCGVTTTSGLAWKIPGRVGDSPILGAGLYVDGEIGAAGSTGRGEANLYNLSSFLVVEEMRRGATPKDAAIAALRRVVRNTVEKRLLNGRGTPNFGLTFYALTAKGAFGAASMYATSYAVCTENGPEILKAEALFPGQATD
jgi:N4-(beta-N-acetylglucosaminyl)-L-asparaginase